MARIRKTLLNREQKIMLCAMVRTEESVWDVRTEGNRFTRRLIFCRIATEMNAVLRTSFSCKYLIETHGKVIFMFAPISS